MYANRHDGYGLFNSSGLDLVAELSGGSRIQLDVDQALHASEVFRNCRAVAALLLSYVVRLMLCVCVCQDTSRDDTHAFVAT